MGINLHVIDCMFIKSSTVCKLRSQSVVLITSSNILSRLGYWESKPKKRRYPQVQTSRHGWDIGRANKKKDVIHKFKHLVTVGILGRTNKKKTLSTSSKPGHSWDIGSIKEDIQCGRQYFMPESGSAVAERLSLSCEPRWRPGAPSSPPVAAAGTSQPESPSETPGPRGEGRGGEGRGGEGRGGEGRAGKRRGVEGRGGF